MSIQYHTPEELVGAMGTILLSSDGGAISNTVTITRPANTTQYAVGDAVGQATGSAILEFPDIGAREYV